MSTSPFPSQFSAESERKMGREERRKNERKKEEKRERREKEERRKGGKKYTHPLTIQSSFLVYFCLHYFFIGMNPCYGEY